MSVVASVRRYATGEGTRAIVLAFVLLLLLLPQVTPGYFTGVMTTAIIFGLFAVAVDIALGYAGLVTLAPAAFFGFGAYSVAKVVVDYGGSFWHGLALSPVLAVVVAILVGYVPIKKRIGPVYFALFTMAFGVIVYDFISVTTWLTGGTNGLGYVSPPSLFGLSLAGPQSYYYFVLVLVGAVTLGLYLLLRSDYGLVLHAIHQNDRRMRFLGYDTDQEKLLAWVISAAVSAVAGALYVGDVGIASPSMASFTLTGEVIIWVILGGSGTFAGPFLAAFLLTPIRNTLGDVWAEGYFLILGLMFIFFIFTIPDGLMGLVRGDEE